MHRLRQALYEALPRRGVAASRGFSLAFLVHVVHTIPPLSLFFHNPRRYSDDTLTPTNARRRADSRGLAARTQESYPGAGVGGCISVWGAMRMAPARNVPGTVCLSTRWMRSNVLGTGAAPRAAGPPPGPENHLASADYGLVGVLSGLVPGTFDPALDGRADGAGDVCREAWRTRPQREGDPCRPGPLLVRRYLAIIGPSHCLDERHDAKGGLSSNSISRHPPASSNKG